MQQVYPQAVTQGPAGYLSVDYSKLVAPLIEVTKQQQARIEQLEYKVRQLKAGRNQEVQAMREELRKLRRSVRRLEANQGTARAPE